MSDHDCNGCVLAAALRSLENAPEGVFMWKAGDKVGVFEMNHRQVQATLNLTGLSGRDATNE